jgi:hypothetical protein
MLQIENEGLKKQLNTEASLFQTTVDEKFRRVSSLERTMDFFFQTVVDEFQDKNELLEDIEEEFKSLPHSEIVSLQMEVYQLKETHAQLTHEFSHLHASVDEIRA